MPTLVDMSDDKPRPADETQPVRPEGATLPGPPAATPATTPSADDGATAPSAAAPGAAYVAGPAPARRGFRERLRSLRSSDGSRTFGLAALIASALAGIIVGGLGFAAVHAVTDDGPGDRGGWMQRGPMGGDRDDVGGRGPMRGGMPGAPGLPGQVQPTTPPEDEDGGSNS